MARKPDPKKAPADFNVVLSAADAARFEESVPEFAQAFGIEPETAAQIVKGCPILFLPQITKSDVRAIKERLLTLSKLGLEFRVTTKPAPGMPRVVWAHEPQFTALANGEVLECANMEWGQVSFMCPECGEVFVMRRVGKALGHPGKPAVEAKGKALAKGAPAKPAAKAEAPPAEEIEPLEAPVPLETIEAVSQGDAEEVQPLDEIPEPVENLQPLQAESEEEGVELLSPEPLEELAPPGEEAEEISLEDASAGGAEEDDVELAASGEEQPEATEETEEPQELEPVEEEAAEVQELEPEEELEELPEVSEEAEEAGQEEEEEEEVPPPPKPAPGKGKAAAKEPPKKVEPAKAAPGKGAAAPAKGAPPKKPEPKLVHKGGEEEEEVLYSVFLSRIPTPEKQVQAAKLICDVRKVPLAEAKELASRMVIPVLKDVAKEEAESVLEKFKKIKVAGRMTKKK